MGVAGAEEGNAPPRRGGCGGPPTPRGRCPGTHLGTLAPGPGQRLDAGHDPRGRRSPRPARPAPGAGQTPGPASCCPRAFVRTGQDRAPRAAPAAWERGAPERLRSRERRWEWSRPPGTDPDPGGVSRTAALALPRLPGDLDPSPPGDSGPGAPKQAGNPVGFPPPSLWDPPRPPNTPKRRFKVTCESRPHVLGPA